MARVTKERFFRGSLRTKEIEIEQLGGTVKIRELPAGVSADLSGLLEVIQVGREQRAKVDVGAMERKQFAYGVVNDDLSPMFTEDEAAEMQSIHGSVFKEIVNEIDTISGIDKEGLEKTEATFPAQRTSSNGSTLGDAAEAGDLGPDIPVRAGGDAPQERPGDDDR